MIPGYLLLPFAIIFSLLTIIGLLGNAFVIIAITGDPQMRKTGLNILLLNLAIADLCNLMLNMCEWIPTVILGRIHWSLPYYMCPICRYLEYVFLFASISTQIMISIERYIAIVHPMHARRYCTRKSALWAVAGIWLFVGIFASPYAWYHTVKRTTYGASCSNTAASLHWWHKFKLAEFLSFYLAPCIVIIFVYARVIYCLWVQSPHFSDNNIHRQNHGCKKNDTLRMRRNVVKMLVACVAVYFICYSPIQVVFLAKTVFHSHYHLSYGFLLVFNALAMTCSASNPLLYTLFSMKFRRKIRELLSCAKYSRVPLMPSTKVRESRVFVSNYTTD